jgi:hypothetical protein
VRVFLAWMFAACNACRPGLPPAPSDGRIDTSSPPEDTAESGVDSGPPPRCDVEEQEPNDSPDAAQALPMELWACGRYDRVGDSDWFHARAGQAGWIAVDVQAAARGSAADAQVQVVPDVGMPAVVAGSYLSTDPRVVFPTDAPGAWSIGVTQATRVGASDVGWFARVSQVKAPVAWTDDEVEPDDSIDAAQAFPLGGVMFGRADAVGDRDWYVFTTPPDEQSWTFEVDAAQFGSLADTKLTLARADGTVLRVDHLGHIDYDPDPWFETRLAPNTTYAVMVRTESDAGGPFHWYTLSIAPLSSP